MSGGLWWYEACHPPCLLLQAPAWPLNTLLPQPSCASVGRPRQCAHSLPAHKSLSVNLITRFF